MIEIRFDKTKDEVALLIWFLVDHSVVVICISRPQNHSLTYREKNCRRGRLRRRQTISRMLKNFATKVYTTFFNYSGCCYVLCLGLELEKIICEMIPIIVGTKK
jgi:hypothetical protein